jgi:hypothetical protein
MWKVSAYAMIREIYKRKFFASVLQKANIQISDDCPQSQLVHVLQITFFDSTVAIVMEVILCQ